MSINQNRTDTVYQTINRQNGSQKIVAIGGYVRSPSQVHNSYIGMKFFADVITLQYHQDYQMYYIAASVAEWLARRTLNRDC